MTEEEGHDSLGDQAFPPMVIWIQESGSGVSFVQLFLGHDQLEKIVFGNFMERTAVIRAPHNPPRS